MKRLLLSAVLALGTLCVQSQELPTIVPPAPEASALANFTEVPVSHYTGLPNISVPIYTIQEGGVSIPIGLSYHARGVQVSEIAPRTGTGWSLSYGGAISRQMRGRSDEHLKGYLNFSNSFTNFPLNELTRAAVMSNDETFSFDFYPDQFTFNAGGVSGKFILDHTDGQPLIQSYGDINITYTQDSGINGTKINAFVMTDPNGTKYYFGISKDGLRTAQDYQNSVGYTVDHLGNQVLDPPATSADEYYSAWKLMDIETVQGDLISFFYESYSAPYWRKSTDLHINTQQGGTTTGVNGMSNLADIRTKISRVQNYEYQISRIEFNEGRDKIEFIKQTTTREDFVGYALDKVAIYHDGNLVKGFDLNYEYTTSTDTSNMLPTLPNQPELLMYFKRLFLKEVAEYGSDNAYLPAYEFTYDSQVLPSVLSSRQDYWGYYNGALDNGPFTRVYPYGHYVPNRRVDTLKSEAGILKEIKYPTGGKVKFTYEHNKGTNVSWSDRVKLPAINPSNGTNYEGLSFLDTLAYNGNKYIGNTFTINPDPNGVSASINVSLLPTNYNSADQNTACANPLQPECGFNITLEGLNGAPTYNLFAGNTDFSNIQSGDYRFVFDPVNDFNWSASPGTWNFNVGGVFTPFPYTFSMEITWQQQSVSNLLYGPGKRIKKIEHIDVYGVVSTKEFEYAYLADLNSPELGYLPSGNIKGLPAFLNTPISGYDSDFFGLTGYTAYYDSGSAYSSFQSNYIGYSGVIEYYGTKDDNIGKTEYRFTNFNDSGGDYFEFPYHPPTDNEWLRGKPVGMYYYKNDGNMPNGDIDYELVKQTHNKYRFGDRLHNLDFAIPFAGVGGFQFAGNTPTNELFVFAPQGEEFDWTVSSSTSNYEKTRTNFRLPLFMVKRYAQGNSPVNNNPYNAYRMYDLTGGTLNLESTTQKSFNDAGEVETITTYGYDYNKHYQLKSTSVTDSKGDVMETINYYPADVLATTDLGYDVLGGPELTAILKLRAPDAGNLTGTHQVATPVQVETKKNASVVSVVRTNFNIVGTLGLVLPKNVETSKAGTALEERIVYHSYYDNGNVKEVSKTDGTRIVYIWGYNQTVPIAKIENATYVQVSGYVAGIQTASNNDNDRTEGIAGSEGTLRTALTNLRNALPNAQMTSFTYDPLIGVTSITDTRGRIVYYHYDSFNRLQFVKDHDGNMVSKTEYNYKN